MDPNQYTSHFFLPFFFSLVSIFIIDFRGYSAIFIELTGGLETETLEFNPFFDEILLIACYFDSHSQWEVSIVLVKQDIEEN
jgi:hypothetical protein